MVLGLRNWIRSGVNKLRDLCFVDGKLDMDSMYDIIVHKGNIYTEILTVREALLPYQEYLRGGIGLRMCMTAVPRGQKIFISSLELC